MSQVRYIGPYRPGVYIGFNGLYAEFGAALTVPVSELSGLLGRSDFEAADEEAEGYVPVAPRSYGNVLVRDDDVIVRNPGLAEIPLSGVSGVGQMEDGEWVIAHDSGLPDATFAKVWLGKFANRVYAAGSVIESTGALAGLNELVGTNDRVLLDPLTNVDLNASAKYGVVEFDGGLLIGDRRGGVLRRAVINESTGALASFTNPYAQVGGEDVLLQHKAWGKQLICTFGLTNADIGLEQNPGLFTVDASGTVLMVADFPGVGGAMGPGSYVSSTAQYGPECWCVVEGTLQVGATHPGGVTKAAEIWSVRQDGTKTLRLESETDRWSITTTPTGELLATRVSPTGVGEAGVMQIMVWDGGGFVPLSQTVPCSFVTTCFIFQLGNELVLNGPVAGFGSLCTWRHDTFRAFAPSAPSGGCQQLLEHDGTLYAAWNQPVRIYSKRLGLRRFYADLGDQQVSFGGATAAGAETAPAITATPSSLAFSAQVDSTTSAAKTVTIENTGNALLTVTPTIAGTHAGDYAVSGDTIVGPISPGGTATVDVTFTPTVSSGARAGILRLSTNAIGTPTDITLSGIASAPPPAGIAPLIDYNPGVMGYASGDPVPVAIDSSGNGHDTTVNEFATLPTYVTAGVSKPSLRFGAGSDSMSQGDISALLTGGVTVVMRFNFANVYPTYWRLLESPDGRIWSNGGFLANYLLDRPNDYENYQPDPAFTLSAGMHTVALRAGPDTYEMLVDGVSLGSNIIPDGGDGTGFFETLAGAHTIMGGFFEGDLERMLFYSGVLSTGQVADIRTALEA